MTFDLKNLRIGVVGLGYVGLPLAVEFGKHYPTVGFDIKAARIAELEQRIAERQLAASQANLAALVENTGDAIWSVDREHRLITFNSAFSNSF